MPTVVHFEVPASNPVRAKKFYGDLFGWKFNKMPGQMPYWDIRTRARKGEHALGGGLMKRQMKGQPVVNYVSVNDLDKYWKKASKLGAKSIVPKTSIPKMGHFMVFFDTENNPVGLWQDDKKAM